MNTVQRIFKNSWASLLIQISTPASSFFIVLFIARYHGASGLGTYSSALSILFFFQAVACLGFPQFITREVSQDPSMANKLLINASFIGIVFSIITAGIMCLVVSLITNSPDTINATYILSISLVPYTLAMVCQSIHQAFEKYEYIMISLVGGNIFKLLFGFFILYKGYGLLNLMIVITAGYTLIFIISLLFIFRRIPGMHYHERKIDYRFSKWIIGAIPIFALTMIVAAVRMNIDILMLTKMVGEREVGFYSAANKLVNIFKLGVSCYIMALQPVIFRLFKSSIEKFNQVSIQSIRYLIIFLMPIIIMTTFFSEDCVQLIFKEEFVPSAKVLSILIWLLILNGLNQIFANIQISSNNQRANFLANLASGIANIVLNLLLIKKFGYVGAGIATIAAAFITLFLQHWFISKYLFKINYFQQVKKSIIASALMGISILLFRDINHFIVILFSTIIYFISLLLLKTFTQKDMDIIRRLWKGEKYLVISEKQN